MMALFVTKNIVEKNCSFGEIERLPMPDIDFQGLNLSLPITQFTKSKFLK